MLPLWQLQMVLVTAELLQLQCWRSHPDSAAAGAAHGGGGGSAVGAATATAAAAGGHVAGACAALIWVVSCSAALQAASRVAQSWRLAAPHTWKRWREQMP